MREFRYKALSPSGETIQGFRSSLNAAALADELSTQNLILLDSHASGKFGQALQLRGGASRRDLLDFTLHMATSLSAGIPIVQALRDIEEGMAGRRLQGIIRDVREEISSGGQVTGALSHHPDVFPDLYVALVEAGENSGKLDVAFDELVGYLEWSGDIQAKVHQALLYPAMISSAAIGLFLLMALYVIPRFMSVFEELNIELPMLTRRMLGIGDFFHYWWPFLLGGVVLLVIGVKIARSYERGRYEIDRLLLRLPVIGKLIEKLALSRFAKHFAMLLGAGIDILKVLSLLERVVGNSVLGAEIRQVKERVMTGETLAGAIEESEHFPPLIKRLITVGEVSGRLDDTLEKAAEYLDKELPRIIKRLFTFMEAGVIVMLGGLIAVCALSMLLPIFQIHSQIMK